MVAPGDAPAAGPVRVVALRLLDGNGHPLADFRAGRALRVAIDFEAADAAAHPRFRVRVLREDGLVCCDLVTDRLSPERSPAAGRGRMTLMLDRLDLNAGHYGVDVKPYADGAAHGAADQMPGCPLVVSGEGAREAVLNVPHHWEIDG